MSLSDSGPSLYTLTVDEDDWHLACVLMALGDDYRISSCFNGGICIFCTIADAHTFDIKMTVNCIGLLTITYDFDVHNIKV